MRLYIDRLGKTVAPSFLGEIAERLEALNASDEDIFEARVIFEAPGTCVQNDNAIKVELLLAGRTLRVTLRGITLQDAVEAVFRELELQLQVFRRRRRRALPPRRETPRPHSVSVRRGLKG